MSDEERNTGLLIIILAILILSFAVTNYNIRQRSIATQKACTALKEAE